LSLFAQRKGRKRKTSIEVLDPSFFKSLSFASLIGSNSLLLLLSLSGLRHNDNNLCIDSCGVPTTERLVLWHMLTFPTKNYTINAETGHDC